MAELLLFKFLFVTLMNKCSIMKTHDFILQKTFGLLLQKGYDGVTVSDIPASDRDGSWIIVPLFW